MPRIARDLDWVVTEAAWTFNSTPIVPNTLTYAALRVPTASLFGSDTEAGAFQPNDRLTLERVRGEVVLWYNPFETPTQDFIRQLTMAIDIWDWDYVNDTPNPPGGIDYRLNQMANRALLWSRTDVMWGDSSWLEEQYWGNWLTLRIPIDVKARRTVEEAMVPVFTIMNTPAQSNQNDGPIVSAIFRLRSLFSRKV